jgi:ParB/RepB/Spo0J family partition protein
MNAIAKDITNPTNAVQNLPLHQLHPHPQNPRLSPRQDVVEQIAAQIVDGFDAAHALIVRPLDIGGYQVISGHHRLEAAKQAGLSTLPCWVRDLSDEDAYMQLVLCNTQSELSEIEIGRHAKESGYTQTEYSKTVGKSQQSVSLWIKAADVYHTCGTEHPDLSASWRNLAEIHAAPKWIWAALVEKMVEDGWTVQVTREKVSKAKSIGDLDVNTYPYWNVAGVASNIVNGVMRPSDITSAQKRIDDSYQILHGSPEVNGDEWAQILVDALWEAKPSNASDVISVINTVLGDHSSAVNAIRADELAKQRDQEAAAAKVERLRANCSLDEWQALSNEERAELLTPEPHPATFNEQKNQDIEWAQWSWNPVTGCKHECSYCYARDIALSERMRNVYPNGFEPTFRSRSLNAPMRQKVPAEAATDTRYRNVFTCSMADLFGRWVPAEWINAVFDTVRANPQWNFLFLTKFPKRMAEFDIPDNAWMGTSVDLQARVKAAESAFENVKSGVRWLSVEPMLEPLKFEHLDRFDWVVIGGASSSSQTPAWFPPVEWIFDLVKQCREAGCKVYLKSNLFGSSDQHRAVNARILELPFDAPVTADATIELPEAFRYLGK